MQNLKHNPNGRFVVVCGDGEYIIYTALAWRNRSFGSALEFAWSSDGEYAVRESTSKIKIFSKSFQVCTFDELYLVSCLMKMVMRTNKLHLYSCTRFYHFCTVLSTPWLMKS
jgi:hypothetical protein